MILGNLIAVAQIIVGHAVLNTRIHSVPCILGYRSICLPNDCSRKIVSQEQHKVVHSLAEMKELTRLGFTVFTVKGDGCLPCTAKLSEAPSMQDSRTITFVLQLLSACFHRGERKAFIPYTWKQGF